MSLLGKRDTLWTIPEAQIAAHQAFTGNVIRSGFASTGVWPFDPKKIRELAERHNQTKNIDIIKETTIDLVRTILLQAKDDQSNLNSLVVKGKALVKKNFPFDVCDHLNSSHAIAEEKKQQAADKATRKRNKIEIRENNKRQKLQEKEQRIEKNTCKLCGHLWRTAPDWVGCDFCDSFWLCSKCSKSSMALIDAHEVAAHKR